MPDVAADPAVQEPDNVRRVLRAAKAGERGEYRHCRVGDQPHRGGAEPRGGCRELTEEFQAARQHTTGRGQVPARAKRRGVACRAHATETGHARASAPAR